MRRTVIALAAAVLTAGCSGSAGGTADGSDSAAGGEAVDVTAELQEFSAGKPWSGLVSTATRTGTDRLEVATVLLASGAGEGSPEAAQAIAVCDGALAWLEEDGAEEPTVSVTADEGSALAESSADGCTEV
jgi:hypothetical protein